MLRTASAWRYWGHPSIRTATDRRRRLIPAPASSRATRPLHRCGAALWAAAHPGEVHAASPGGSNASSIRLSSAYRDAIVLKASSVRRRATSRSRTSALSCLISWLTPHRCCKTSSRHLAQVGPELTARTPSIALSFIASLVIACPPSSSSRAYTEYPRRSLGSCAPRSNQYRPLWASSTGGQTSLGRRERRGFPFLCLSPPFTWPA